MAFPSSHISLTTSPTFVSSSPSNTRSYRYSRIVNYLFAAGEQSITSRIAMSHSNSINTSVTPRLSVQTASPQAGPSSAAGLNASGTGSLGRRPLGARKRGVAPGLFVANPDDSDDDGTSPTSKASPITPGTGSGTGNSFASGVMGNRTQQQHPTLSLNDDPPRGLPTIPQPQTTPATPQQQPPSHSISTPNLLHATPPQPPPQPDRHLARRAFTSPVPPDQLHGHTQHRPNEVRHGSMGGGGHAPSSPSRGTAARPALPSPPIQSSSPPVHGTGHDTRRLPPNPRMSSPEEALSPASGSSENMGRARAGSFNAATKRLLQVTTDNEQFTLVDITGMNTADAIRDRIFTKVSTLIGRV